MPIATADTLVMLLLTTRIFPVSSTIPVLSSTPLAAIVESYSMYSALVGVAAAATAIRMVIADAFRLQMLNVATVNVSAGTVYTYVSVAAAKSDAPRLPVAILILHWLYLCQHK
jgi:hypothetical protein